MHVLLQELCRRHHPAVLLVTHDVDEAILLADRVVVLDDGRITLDVEVALAAPRLSADREFGELRSLLLAALGIDEIAEGART
jgi:sulfonate transport system ATP-binding protein